MNVQRPEMLNINGSIGEGGGQILRSSLALSLCRNRPFRIFNIRASRKQPGLRNQHLTTVLAAGEISDAAIEGAALGSQELSFVPLQIKPGRYEFNIGTAGSTTLLLQTILPALLTANGESRLTIKGGTHNPQAPPFDFLQQTFLPLLRRMGAQVTARLERPGFYPVGGGIIQVAVEPIKHIKPLILTDRGKIMEKCAVAMLANLPEHIAERELNVVSRELGLLPNELQVKVLSSTAGAGNVVNVVIKSQYITEVFTSFGRRGLKAEKVAKKLVPEVRRYLTAAVPVGEHLADQLLLPVALASGGAYITLRPSLHATTNIAVIEKFMGINFNQEMLAPDVWRISL